MSAKYTPGPWETSIETANANGWRSPRQQITISANGVLIAAYTTEFVEYPDDATNKANALLMGAAPELLDVLQFIALLTDKPVSGLESVVNERARAAIAKATGGAA